MPPETPLMARVQREDIRRTEDFRQNANASAVLQAVLDHGPVARSTIARLAALSPAAVSRLCGELVAAGLVREAPEAAAPNGVGRPHVPVEVDTGRRVACGLHIAAGYSTLALVDLHGRVVARERLDHVPADPEQGRPEQGRPEQVRPEQSRGDQASAEQVRRGQGRPEQGRAEQALRRVARRLPGFVGEHAGGRTLLGLGVACGGWVDRGHGVIMENAPLGWRDVPAGELLAAETGLPVWVDSHARALARAEQMFGDVRARASVAHLFVGNVVDAAFAAGGAVHHGPRSAAGLVAHLPMPDRADPCPCGRRGCLQAAVSDRALAHRAARQGIIPGPAYGALLALARNGDRRAVRLFRDRARLIGAAAALLLDLLNPELLVVTEAGVVYLPECLEDLRAEVTERSRACGDPGRCVVATSFGGDALPVAAGAVVLDEVYANPLGRRRSAMRQAS